MKDLMSYIPKKNRSHIIDLYREDKHICILMKWEDGYARSKVADSIYEMKWMIDELEEDREAQF